MPVKIQAIRERRQDWVGSGLAQVAASQTAFLKSALGQLQRYPPPNSDYVRTGSLGRSWTGRVTPTGSIVENRLGYSSYVQGPQGKSGRAGGQTAVMAGKGWTSVTTAAKVAQIAAAAAAAATPMATRVFGKV
jgi:hypothetical protein